MSAPSSSGPSGGVGPSRRTWDKDDFARKAMSREKRQAELDSVNAERRSQGLPPLKRLKSTAPEPELSMQQRSAPLGLDKNQGKTLMVDLSSDSGQTGPGFYCQTCRKLLKDNLAYLDHINGRVHLMRIGQSTQQDRASLQDVLAMLDRLRQERGAGGNNKSAAYDFDQRIKSIADQQEMERQQRRQKRRDAKNAKKPSTSTAVDQPANDDDDNMLSAMGFGGFGSTKKR